MSSQTPSDFYDYRLARLPEADRWAFLKRLPERIDVLAESFHDFGLPVRRLFEAVGANYETLCETLRKRQSEVLAELTTGWVSQPPRGTAAVAQSR